MHHIFGKYYDSTADFDRLDLPDPSAALARAHVHRWGTPEADALGARFRARLEAGQTLYLLGVQAFYHNAGLALVEASAEHGLRLLVNLEEERFTGKKHFAGYPAECVAELKGILASKGLSSDDIFCCLYGWDVTEYERGSQKTFILNREITDNRWFLHLSYSVLPPQALERLDAKKKTDYFIFAPLLAETYTRLMSDLGREASDCPCVQMLHHENHAYFAWGASPFYRRRHEQSPVIVSCIDGVGDLSSSSLYVCRGDALELVRRHPMSDSLGVFYMLCACFLGGWSALSSEGRYMGAAAWGNSDRLTNPFYRSLRQYFYFGEGGTIRVNSALTANDHALLQRFTGELLEPEQLWNPDAVLCVDDIEHSPITRERVDKAAAVQMVFEDALFHIIGDLILKTGGDKLVMCGGTALNCVANMRLLERFDRAFYMRYLGQDTRLQIWVPPIPSDQGVVPGAAFQFAMRNGARATSRLPTPFLCGAPPTTEAIREALEQSEAVEYLVAGNLESAEDEAAIADFMAYMVSRDGVLGIFDGAAETGPRALGHRTFLANPCNPDTLAVLNGRVKMRERIRPLAPMVTREEAERLFHLEEGASADDYVAYDYMVMTTRARPEALERVPAVVHHDGTSRIQIVREENNRLMHRYLRGLGRYLGVEVSVNTSLNVGGAIVQTPSQALELFNRAKGIDCLVMVGADGAVFYVWAREGVQPYPSRLPTFRAQYRAGGGASGGPAVRPAPMGDPRAVLAALRAGQLSPAEAKSRLRALSATEAKGAPVDARSQTASAENPPRSTDAPTSPGDDRPTGPREILAAVRAGRLPAEAARSMLLGRRRVTVAPASVEQGPGPATTTDIAIIGIAGRFPDADDLTGFWHNVRHGRIAVREPSSDRGWAIGDYHDPAPQTPGRTYSRHCAWLADVDRFDPAFFGITPREAERMDPSERLFLQEAWHAIEDAGYAASDLKGAAWGVFACAKGDYDTYVLNHDPSWHAPTDSYAPARLSYLLDLSGPCVAVDTACSSTLMAIAQACDALVLGNAEVAIAGGGGVYSTPNMLIYSSQAGLFSPRGRCTPFDAAADGTLLGEAIGAVVLKPLAAAQRDGDPIRAVIKGWSSNHDGRTNGMTAPSARAQSRLLRSIYTRFGIDPRDITLVEAHGTGTRLGDPIEVDALRDAFGHWTADRGYCALGSVKANIGHAFFGAGIAGVAKVVMALAHGEIPPQPGFEQPNPLLELDESPFYVPSSLEPWSSRGGRPRLAAVSAFGATGVNVHLVLAEAPPTGRAPAHRGEVAIVLSARDARGLREVAGRLLAHLDDEAGRVTDLASLACTLQTGRAPLAVRLGFVAGSLDAVKARLADYLEGRTADVFEGEVGGDAGILDVFQSDDDLRVAVDKWLTDRRYRPLLRLWCHGLVVDWRRLYPGGTPRRVHLPGYPFARERHWIADRFDADAPRTRKALFVRRWRPAAALARAASGPGPVAILSGAGSDALARCVAERVPDAEVRRQLDGRGWQGVIDLRATARDPGGLDWLPPLQALVERAREGGARLIAVSRGLERIDSDAAGVPSGAHRAAVYRMLSHEHPAVRATHLDLDPAGVGVSAEAEAIVAEYRGDSTGAVAVRGGRRLMPTLAELSVDASGETVVAAGHTLWITGGTRGLGLLCARHATARYGARRLVLIGRSATLTPASAAVVDALRADGVQVDIAAPALSDASALRALALRTGPVGGVIHCAGLADHDDPAFVRKPIETFERVMAPKVRGLDTLLDAVKDEPLAFFALFSSVAGLVPALGVGQSDYALANAYMDAVATHRAGRVPFRLVSLQWPSWRDTGMGEATSVAYRESGLASHSDADGLALLDRALAVPHEPVMMPAVVDVRRFRPDTLLQWHAPRSVGAPRGPRPTPASAPASASADGIRGWVAAVFADELRMQPGALEPDRAFADYGVDSVLLTQIKARIDRALGSKTDPSLMFTAPTLHAYSTALAEAHGPMIRAMLESSSHNDGSDGTPGPARRESTDDTGSHRARPDEQPPASAVEVAAAGASRRRRGPLRIRHILDVIEETPTSTSATAEPTDGSRSAPTASARPATDGHAIVGWACRFPGAADVDSYWRMLVEGRSAIRSAQRPGWGERYHVALLDDLGLFDPDYFLLSRSDAAAMDPQALLVLEESLAAIYDAGYDLESIKGRRIGVYLGARSHHDPGPLLERARNPIVAAGQNYLAANVSHFFDLRGPSMVVDTACSSSLVALDLALRALDAGRIDGAIVGGVCALSDDRALKVMSRRGLLVDAPAMHVFDRRAAGVALGEGVGVVVLERVADAQARGHAVRSIIRGVGINNDGRTAGPASPNFAAHQAVMRDALARSGARPEDVGYVEVNGSGSEATDLLELKAIQAVYRPSGGRPLELGSAKPHIGHPLCAEGIAALIKAALTVAHRTSVPFISGQEPMSFFDLGASSFHLARAREPWPGPRLAAVNCFADGGVNAHVVLEGPPPGVAFAPLRPAPRLARVDVRAGAGQRTLEPFSKRLVLDAEHPVLAHHRAHGQSLLPGMAYIDLVYGVLAEKGHDFRAWELASLTLFAPLTVDPDYDVVVRLVGAIDGRGWRIDVSGTEMPRDGGTTREVRYASISVEPRSDRLAGARLDIEQIRRTSTARHDLASFYAAARTRALVHTGSMQARGTVYTHPSGSVIELDAHDIGARFFHPALLDGAAVAFAGVFDRVAEEQRLYLPLAFGRFRAEAPLQERCVARIPRASVAEHGELLTFALEVYGEGGRLVARVDDIKAKLVRRAGLIARRHDAPQAEPRSGTAPTLRPGEADPIGSPPSHGNRAGIPSTAGGDASSTVDVEHLLATLLAEQLAVEPDAIDPDAGYYELGLDSAGLLDMVARLEAIVGSRLAPTLFFEFTTVARLAAHLAEVHPGSWAAPRAGDAPRDAAIAADRRGDDRPAAPNSTPTTRHAPVATEDIAIIGLAGRYPRSRDIRAFWDNLLAGADCIDEIPAERWDYEARCAGITSPSGKPVSRFGGFVADHDRFDPIFFRIAPREAETMDPQDRLFLETCWEAIEDAGYTPDTLSPPSGPEGFREVGVFCGIMHKDYTLVSAEAMSPSNVFNLTLNYAPIPNRVSYVCDFHGPSMAVDTVCSSSLTTVHLAVQSLLTGECRVAIAGGVNLSLHPAKYMAYGIGELHSVDGRCRAFGEGGTGYVSAEGVGAVILKPLADAERDGDHIYAVIRGSAINHVGRVSGITVPSPVAQAAAIRSVHEKTGIDPRTVSYVEAHGTGTALGDPIEMQGLTRAYRAFTADTGFCAIGSVKSNMGHGESAAGIMGLTKAVLQLHHRTLVPSLHAETLNPHIDFESTPFYVQRERQHWARPAGWPRRAGVSSYGATGANAHVLLEEYVDPRPGHRSSGPMIFPLSARAVERLVAYARRVAEFLAAAGREGAGVDLGDLAWTFQVGRVGQPERVAFVARDVADLLDQLRAFVSAPDAAGPERARGKAKRRAPKGSDAEVAAALAAHDLLRLARLWVAGADVPWRALSRGATPQRISAPTYPFARKRYWVPQPPAGASPAAARPPQATPRAPYRLDDLAPASGEDAAMRATIDRDAFFLRDHVFAGDRIIPGVVTLDVVLRCVRRRWPESLAGRRPVFKGVAWLRRAVATGPVVRFRVGLSRAGHDRIRYTVAIEGDDGATRQQGLGRVELLAQGAPPSIDIDARRAVTAETTIDGPALYRETFTPMGWVYGPAHQSVARLHRGGGELLVDVALPPVIADTIDDFVFHPSLLDGPLQGAVGLFTPGPDGRVPPHLPFAFESIEVFEPLQPRMWASIRWQSDPQRGRDRRIDFDLTCPDGRVLLRVRGFTGRPVETAAPAAPGAIVYTPRWLNRAPVPRAVAPVARHLFVCDGLPVIAGAEHLAGDFEAAARRLFEVVRGIVRGRSRQPTLIQVAVPSDGEVSTHSGLSGLLRVAELEHPRLSGQVLVVPSDIQPEALAHRLAVEATGADRLVRIDGAGHRRVRLFEPLPAEPTPVAWRDGCVYVISGGAGGLGRIFAEDAARHLTRGALLLLGRSRLDDGRRRDLEALGGAGVTVRYAAVDVTDAERLRATLDRFVAEQGPLAGVIHSAGVIRDDLILRKDPDDFSAVMAPKVAGARALDAATHDQPLDFFVVFSSGAGVTGNLGQSDYAAANAWLDAFAAWRAGRVDAGERRGRSLSVDWPLWRSGGMRVSAAIEAMMARQTGMVPLETAAGIAAFHGAVAGEQTQVLVMAGDPERLGRFLTSRDLAAASAEPGQGAQASGAPPIARAVTPDRPAATRSTILPRVAAHVAAVLKLPAAELEPDVELAEYGVDSIMAIQIIDLLEREFDGLPKTLIFDHPTLGALAGYLAAEYGGSPGDPEASAPAPLRARLAGYLADVIKMPAAEIDPEVPFGDYGVDSIMAIQIIHAMEEHFGPLPKTLLFDHPTLGALTGHLAADFGGGSDDAEASPSSAPAEPAAMQVPLRAQLARYLADVVKIPASEIDPDVPFGDYGVDSIMAIQIIHAMEDDLGPLPKTLLFDHPTLAELAEYVRSEQGTHADRADVEASPDALDRPVEPADEPDREVELAYGQQAFCYLYEADPSSAAYHVPLCLRLFAPVTDAALTRALERLVRHHPSLRAVFPHSGDVRTQRIRGSARVTVHSRSIEGFDDDDALELAHACYLQPFDLESGPLLRLHALRRAPDDTWLVLVAHHIVCDGWSLGVVGHDLGVLLEAELDGVRIDLPPPTAEYVDFVAREQALVRGPGGDRHRAYWHEKLAGPLPTLELPLSHPRPPMVTYNGATLVLPIDGPLIEALRAFGRREGTSLFATLLTGFEILLARVCGQDDIVIGAPFSGRTEARFGRVIGDLVNPVVLRADLSGDPSVREVARRIRRVVHEGLAHQEYPFARLIEELQVPRDPARSPIFEVMFNYIQMPDGFMDTMGIADGQPQRTRWGGLEVESFYLPSQEGQLSLTFETLQIRGGLFSVLKYNTDLFDEADARRLGDKLVTILRAMVDDPEQRLSAVPLWPAVTAAQVAAWNDTAADHPRDATLHGLFDRAAAAHPDAPALICGDEAVCYAALRARAHRIAHALIERGLSPGDRCALFVRPSVDMIAAILAVLKAGATYVPVDPEYPVERVRFLVDDSDPAVVFADDDLVSTIGALTDIPVLSASEVGEASDAAPAVPTAPDDIAYIIYTSGSTGTPKGCRISHHNVVRLMINDRSRFDFGPSDVWVLAHSYCFDFSVWEMYGALLFGGALVIPERQTVRDVGCLLDLVLEHRVTVLNQTPGAFYALSDEALARGPLGLEDHLRYVVLGGDKLLPARLSGWAERYPLDRIALINMFGITETTVHVTWYRLAEQDLTDTRPGSPIGWPLPETTVYVLDERGEPLPAGEPGEMYVGGTGVSVGYLGRPELTAQRFASDPFSEGGRRYRTGDLAVRQGDGSLRYLGRNDHQVKIRGHRIETKEVEHALLTQDGVREAIVLAHGEPAELIGFIVLDGVSAGAVSDALAASLPGFMVPARMLVLDEIPLTGNGKVDRRALLEGARDRAAREHASGSQRAPADRIERLLVTVWSDLLDLEHPPGLGDDYFSLGGDSLNAGQMAARLRRELGVALKLPEVLRHPTVPRLAALLRERLHLDDPERVDLDTETQSPAPARADERTPRPNADTAWSALLERPIPRRPSRERFPLTHNQQRLWVLDQMGDDDATYVVPLVLLLEGSLDLDALTGALQAIVQRHDILRAVFELDGEQPVQRILAPTVFEVPFVDLSDRSDAQDEARLRASALIHQPFDLTAGPLVRASVMRVSDDRHVFVMTMHHIVVDGASLGVLFDELGAIYRAMSAGHGLDLPPPLQYADYADWAAERLSGSEADAHRAAWLDRLGDVSMAARLPTERARPARQTFGGQTLVRPLPDHLTASLTAFARERGTTLFMALLGVTQILISKYAGSRDVIVGTPMSGRDHPDLERVVGLLVNTVPLHTRIDPDMSVTDLLDRVRDAVGEGIAHQSYPFDRLIQDLGVTRDLSRSPLFDVMVALLDRRQLEPELPGLETSIFEVPYGVAKFDLTFEFALGDAGRLEAWLEYNTDLFDAGTIERFWAGWVRICEAAVARPAEALADLPFLPDGEADALWRQGTGPTVNVDPDLDLTRLFESQVAATPDAVAILDEEGELSYAELDRAANRLARALMRRANLLADDVVAIRMGRSRSIPIAVLGVLKTGAAYLPLDPRLPAERRRFILEDAGCRVAVADAGSLAEFDGDGLDVVLDLGATLGAEAVAPLDADDDLVDLTCLEPDDDEIPGARPTDLAYVVYTSGSTGRPKGVMVEHGAVVNLVTAMHAQIYAAFDAPVEELFSTSLAFDVAAQQLFCTLTRGDRLRIATDDALADPRRLLDTLRAHPVEIVDLTPSQFVGLLDAGLDGVDDVSLRQISLGSEALPVELLRRLRSIERLRSVRIVNYYGPTEACVNATFWIPGADLLPDVAIAPIGRPLANIEAHVVNAHLQVLPAGVVGEIVLGGAGLARGYLNRPELTAERFVTGRDGQRLYRTGDSGRVEADGSLRFVGRLDDQVKLRGLRIELGDVEAAIAAWPPASSAAVVVDGTGAAPILVGYVVAPEEAFDVDAIRAHLAARLPDYMVPARLVRLERMPLTASGKVDRKALPAPNATGVRMVPETETEEHVVGLFEAVTGRRPVGVTDSFFDSGGNSLSAVQVLMRVEDRYEVEVPLMNFLEAPTARALAEAVDRARSGGGLRGLARLGGGGGPALFCLPPIFGYGAVYAGVVQALDAFSVFALDLPDGDDPVAECAASILAAAPDGPVHLLGYSAGGNLAFRVARVLESAGREVAGLWLLDAVRRTAPQAMSTAERDAHAEDLVAQYLARIEADDAVDGLTETARIRHRMLSRTRRYIDLLEGRPDDGRIRADIGLLTSTTDFGAHGWQAASKGEVRSKAGVGTHEDMIFGAFARENGKRLRALMTEVGQARTTALTGTTPTEEST